nr:zinc finger BED domain-containing protein RICESLEEPER 2-like [Ipomoea trifida]
MRKKTVQVGDNQTKLNFLPSDGVSSSIPPLHHGRVDMEVVRESTANWIMMHEHPFTLVEEAGFNVLMKRIMPEWKRISRSTIKSDCLKVYEIEKKKLKNNLESVSKKRVLSFINIPPPRGGLQISDVIFKCMKEWGIERKVFTITVDNATSNDSTIRYMKDTLQRSRSLEARENISKVKEIINTLYEEYVVESMNKGNSETPGSSNTFGSQTTHPTSTYHWDDFDAYCEEVETAEPTRSELILESRMTTVVAV